MPLALQIALTATPIATYFYMLGVFHGGRRPRLVAGPVDVGLLAFGLGGLVAFGPFGRAVLGRLSGDPPSVLAWSLWVGAVALWALILAGSASLRMTIYNVSPNGLEQAVGQALSRLEGRFEPTLNGFEDAGRKVGVKVKSVPFLRSGSVEAYGKQPDSLIRELRPQLRSALDQAPQRASRISQAMYGLACLTMLIPASVFLIANPRAKDAFRTLMQSIRWW